MIRPPAAASTSVASLVSNKSNDQQFVSNSGEQHQQPAAAVSAAAAAAGDSNPIIPIRPLSAVAPEIHIPNENIKLKPPQFLSLPLVDERIATACKDFTEATAALTKSRQQLERFKANGAKQGRSKQLPANLCLNMVSRTRLIAVPDDDKFYEPDMQLIRQLERVTSDQYFDLLVSAREKHIKLLERKCNIAHFTTLTVAEFRPALDRFATKYNIECGIDPLVPSQSQSLVVFQTELVASHFESQLRERLMAQAIARAESSEKEEKRRADQTVDEHQAQEAVLAGAHTGQTISSIAQKTVDKRMNGFETEIRELKKLLQQQLKATSTLNRQPTEGRQQPRDHKQPMATDASSSRAAPSDSSRSGAAAAESTQSKSADSEKEKVTAPKSSLKRKRESDTGQDRRVDDAGDDKDDNQSSSSSTAQVDQGANKRSKVVFTLPPKNGEGGDGTKKPDQHQPPRSSRPVVVPFRNNANQKGRGPRSGESQAQRRH